MGELRLVRRIVGILGAALARGVAVVGSREFDADRARVMRQEARRTAEAAGQRAADGLSAHLAELRLKADTAASNPRLVFALQGNVDERTMRDLWRTEEWWRPWRTEFKVYALAFGGPRLDVVEGVGANDLSVGSLLRRVRERGDSAAEIVAGRTGPYAAAATLVPVPGREHPAVLVLARPVDPAALRAIADKAAGPVALALDGRVVADAGAAAERSLQASGVAGRRADDAALGRRRAAPARRRNPARRRARAGVRPQPERRCGRLGRDPGEGSRSTGRAGAAGPCHFAARHQPQRPGAGPAHAPPRGHHRPLHVARPPGRRRLCRGLHGGDVWRGGVSPEVRGQAPAPQEHTRPTH